MIRMNFKSCSFWAYYDKEDSPSQESCRSLTLYEEYTTTRATASTRHLLGMWTPQESEYHISRACRLRILEKDATRMMLSLMPE
eukprot:4145271-Amphidinium_carterae.1